MTETTIQAPIQPASATTHKSPLHDFLAPDSIAIVGASADPTKRGYKAMVGLIKGNYRGRIYPLNPKVPEILDEEAKRADKAKLSYQELLARLRRLRGRLPADFRFDRLEANEEDRNP